MATAERPKAVGLRAAAAISDRVLADRRYRNDLIWASPRRWWFGLYFGQGDSRLWVPRRRRDGSADRRACVINFRHAEGRRALPILALAYGSGALLLAFAVCFLASHM